MEQNLTVGKAVKIIKLPDYLKTADSMPMLRPAKVLAIGEEGTIIDRRPGGYWSVLFPNRGSFLLESQYLQVVND